MSDYRFKIIAYGHENVRSKHKSTFEITTDKTLTLNGDCIIGLNMDKTMLDFPEDFKSKLRDDNTKVIINLETPNASDSIHGCGDKNLILSHPSDIVCRKSDFICNRTLMVKSDKAARDLNPCLVEDLSNGLSLSVEILLL